ncbi:MAG: tRNA pseudouridine(55) synthase TruB [Candidatus Taylorbacteria bacterium]|nr:tRNA pseudouridine(55) synthase TruB [Candidatus Taylorbacteria bacterium]
MLKVYHTPTVLPEHILLIDKPKGITSFDCIRILRKKLNIRKMGHAGTLDPMATGLMIIGVGDGTKKLHEFLKLDKTYEAEILLGVKTDTGDITGQEVPISNSQFSINFQDKKFSNEEIEKILQTMIGKLELPVPAYSAIKRGGEALYKKARRGEVVDTPSKVMEITAVEFLGVSSPPPQLRRGAGGGVVVSVRFDVTSGTYIRSLAEEFGRRLGVPATLAGLRRTRIGEFKIEDAEVI